VKRINGHDFREIEEALTEAKSIKGKPQIIIADTIKGKGISFMEIPKAMEMGHGLYPWHSGAPDDESFSKGYSELIDRINKKPRWARIECSKSEIHHTRTEIGPQRDAGWRAT